MIPKEISIENLQEIAIQAGAAILEIYGTEFSVDVKEDKSPLTEADKQSNDVIVSQLEQAYPHIPIISEETQTLPYDERKEWEYFWLVDPLDGTKEFIKRNGEFTVNIALIHKNEPVLGVVYQPVVEKLYWGVSGQGAWSREGKGSDVALKGGVHYSSKQKVTVVASRSHMTQEVEDFVEILRGQGKEVDFLSAGSSLKLCLVAEGAADVYPRLGPTMEWDTGAAHAVALGAGRRVLSHDDGEPLRYNKQNLLNPFFVVE